MATHVVRFSHSHRIQWGLVFQNQITPLPGEYDTTADFIRSNPVEGLREFSKSSAASKTLLALADVQILSPVT
ncbi:MAG: DUF2437 domain-containing protein, partial [Rubrivivax sp.]|nr:DUF2437 domain-containing protein [Rubrivivax sp.]